MRQHSLLTSIYERELTILTITTLCKFIIALPIMRDNGTIFRTTIIRTDTPNDDSIRSWTPTIINTAR
jgi:hypothetical protein